MFVAFSVFFSKPYVEPHYQHVLTFIEYLAIHMSSPASVRNVISSLSTSYKKMNWECGVFTCFHVLNSLRSLDHNVRYMPVSRPPIAPDQLDLIITYCLTRGESTVACALAFSFAGFLRQSNLAPKSAKAFDPTRHFTRGDVSVLPGSLRVRVKWTKTIQKYRDGTHVTLPAIPGRPLCPVSRYNNMLADRPTTTQHQPLFTFRSGAPMTLNHIQSTWRTALLALGLAGTGLSLHSLRRGGCTAARQSGATPTDLKQHGTWVSDDWRTSASPPVVSTVPMALSSLAKWTLPYLVGL